MSALSFQDACAVLSAEEYASRLILAGWTKVPCKACNALGYFELGSTATPAVVGEMFQGVAKAQSRRMCYDCAGEGEQWREPAK